MVELSQILEEISNNWTSAVTESFSNHLIAQKIRKELPNIIKNIVANQFPTLEIKSSAGAGNWANVPWLSILDPKITDTTQEGIYPVYLFKADGTGVYLSLNQGTTNPANLLGKNEAEKQALETSQFILESIDGLKDWGDTSIDLAASTPLGKSYERSNIIAKYYAATSIPDDQQLQKDLLSLLEFYSQIRELNIPKEDVVKKNKLKSTSLPKPFILLSGISGTGKTRFVKQQALCLRDDGSNYQLVPVRPDWHEPSDLLGYISRLGNNGAIYIVTDFLRFLVAAWQEMVESVDENEIIFNDNTIPYWLCLDEMNLAPVEQYFADYLSVIETREWDDNGQYRCEPLLNASIFTQVDDPALLRTSLNLDGDDNDDLWAYFLKNGISIPPNLIVAGTVNMDETTHGFSRKVIDRAFTLDFGEFFPNDYQAYFEPRTQAKTLSYATLSRVDEAELANYDGKGTKSIAFLEAINSVLNATPFELAYRALNELLIAVVCFEPSDDIALQAVWDDFLMTKVLPRIEGDAEKLHDDGETSLLRQLEIVLEAQLSEIWSAKTRPDLLREAIDGSKLTITCRSKKKVNWMQQRLTDNSFTSFWP